MFRFHALVSSLRNLGLPGLLVVAGALSSSVVLEAAGANDDPILVTVLKVKASYRAKQYDEADNALKQLSELIAAPERAAVRPRVLPVYHFYSAAVAWEKKDEARAKEQLLRYLSFQPDARVDPSAYPKSFRIFFEAQQNEVARHPAENPSPEGPQTIGGDTLPAFSTADFDRQAIPGNNGAEDWVDSPVKYLLSDDERRAYKRLSDESTRREYIDAFWKRLNPNPRGKDGGENEVQLEFYRRVQYADANFSTEQTRGALSDRGMVLLVLGPPNYVGRTALLRSSDVMNYLRTTEVQVIPSLTGGASIQRVPSNRSSVTPGEVEGDVETWYYRKDRIPKGISFNDLEYQFLTRRGYGSGVLQKEARELTALKAAARLLKHETANN
ncbi:MAG: GWxTD domain-containing protein [Thermoanaerobaculia bacterium]